MKIYRLAVLADDLNEIYDGLKDVLKDLDADNPGKVKRGIQKAIKRLQEMRPYLKYKDRPLRGFMGRETK